MHILPPKHIHVLYNCTVIDSYQYMHARLPPLPTCMHIHSVPDIRETTNEFHALRTMDMVGAGQGVGLCYIQW